METNSAKICVPVCARTVSELNRAVIRAAESADIIELRVDCLADGELEQALREMPGLLRQSGRPTIVTMRSPEQGGHNSLSFGDRYRFWSTLAKLAGDSLFDLELDLIPGVAADNSWDWNRVICSHHDFAGMPGDLDQLYERMASTPARILKIAFQANDIVDCLGAFRLLDRAQSAGREMIAVAMGQAGIITRILGPSRGSFLTYGSLDDESGTAPGQLQARQLREVYRIDNIDRQTEIVGLIGMPVHHSLSPHIHNAAFAAAGLNAVYLPFEVRDAIQFMRRMVCPQSRELDWNLRGLSVTAPHKSTVVSALDWIEPTAREIGAVNTIVIDDGKLHGYNTDTEGFLSPLREKYGSLKGTRCAIIGAGGVVRAALWGLRREQAVAALFVRDPEKARTVADEFGAECHSIEGASFQGFDIVVNATPLGTSGEREVETPVSCAQLGGVRLAYDLVYNPLETRFQREAQMAGCETIGGIQMLVAQAIEQFKLWTGRDPDVQVMRAAALRALGV